MYAHVTHTSKVCARNNGKLGRAASHTGANRGGDRLRSGGISNNAEVEQVPIEGRIMQNRVSVAKKAAVPESLFVLPTIPPMVGLLLATTRSHIL
jgi:hypothetical protein